MGPRDSAGLQVGVALTTPKEHVHFSIWSAAERRPNKSSERIGGQGSDSASLEPERRIFQPHVCDSQGKGLCVPGDQSRSVNTYLVSHYFKMEGIRVVKSLIQKGSLIGRFNLKDDFLSVPIHSTHRRYPFQWEEQAGNFRPCHSV